MTKQPKATKLYGILEPEKVLARIDRRSADPDEDGCRAWTGHLRRGVPVLWITTTTGYRQVPVRKAIADILGIRASKGARYVREGDRAVPKPSCPPTCVCHEHIQVVPEQAFMTKLSHDTRGTVAATLRRQAITAHQQEKFAHQRAKVELIRSSPEKSLTQLSKETGLHRTHISAIRNFRRWKPAATENPFAGLMR